MLTHNAFSRPDLAGFVHGYHGPLIALGVALLLAVAARMLRMPVLGAASAGAGVVAGWFALGSTSFSWLYRLPADILPRLPADRLWVLGVWGLAGGMVIARLNPTRALWPLIAGLAVVAAWWLAGVPITRGELFTVWPLAAGATAAIVLMVYLIAAPAIEPIRIVAAAVTLAVAFHQVEAPRVWIQLALVPAAAALPLRLIPVSGWLVMLPLALDLGALDVVAVSALGRLPRGGFRAMDAAALTPFLTLGLLPWLATRLSGTGRAARVLAAITAFCLSMAALWVWLRVRAG
jgi:hypothetical protein